MTDDNMQAGYKGAWIKAKGPWIIICLLLAGLSYMVVFSLGKWGHPFDIGEELISGRQEVRTAHQGFQEALNESNFILAACLSPVRVEECKKIGERLSMPESLRKKLRQE